jgi:hypothetical protein
LKVAEAEFKNESVAVTVLAPTDEEGTTKVTPEGIAPELVAVVEVTMVPSYFIVTAEDGAKFDPETVIVEPTTPVVGLKEIDGATTVNVCEVAELEPSLAVTL